MKRVVLSGIREMRVSLSAVPALKKDNDVLIRIKSIGVCGSDIHYFTQGKIGVQVVQFPFALGHECAGIIEQVGHGVKHLKIGDRVAIDPAMPCFECDQCSAGRHHTCRNLSFLGCPGQAEGCLAEYLVMPETSCYKVPDTMSMEEAALVEPLSIGLYSAKLGGVLKGKHVVIMGFGPIGYSVYVCARFLGAEKIYVTDKLDYRLKVAKAKGADWTGNPNSQDIVNEILMHEPQQADIVFECCGQQEAIDQAVEILKPGGKIVLTGIPDVSRICIDIDKMRRKELVLQNVRRQVDCVEPAIELIHKKHVDVSDMITHRYKFENTNKAFELVAGYKDGVMKAMIGF